MRTHVSLTLPRPPNTKTRTTTFHPAVLPNPTVNDALDILPPSNREECLLLVWAKPLTQTKSEDCCKTLDLWYEVNRTGVCIAYDESCQIRRTGNPKPPPPFRPSRKPQLQPHRFKCNRNKKHNIPITLPGMPTKAITKETKKGKTQVQKQAKERS